MLITDSFALRRFYSDRRVWQGIPGIAVTRGGRTFVSFYSGNVKETYGNFALLLRSDDGVSYGEPIAVAFKEGAFRCFDPVLWIDPMGRLWFIWNVMPGEEVMAAVCDDPDADELVWSEELYIGRGVMMNKPTVLSTGEWLFPIALWRRDLGEGLRRKGMRADDVPLSYVYKTSDNGKTFLRLGGADVPNREFDEHMVYEMQNGVLRMLVRVYGGIGESYSYDRGKSWSRGHTTELGGPCSRFFVQKLRSGRVLLINHYRFEGRNNLTALLSEDDGASFPYTLLLDGRNAVSYPDAMETEDGRICIVYDRERGCFLSSLDDAYASAREILTASVTEADIMAGELVSEGSYLARVACKLGRLAEGEPDPYTDADVCSFDLARELIESGEEDPIGRVFEKYPNNCAGACRLNFKKIDDLIRRFEHGDNADISLLARIIKTVKAPSAQRETEPIVAQVEAYVRQNLSQSLSVSEIADHFSISRYYLAHAFKDATGTTVTEYRNEMRLTRAKRLLLQTDESVTDIALSVGFESSSYFSEVFLRSERITPTEYRQIHREKRG